METIIEELKENGTNAVNPALVVDTLIVCFLKSRLESNLKR